MTDPRNPELEDQASDIVLDLVEVPEAERAAVLDRLCGGNDALRALVDRLLISHLAAEAEGFLQRPAFENLSPSVVPDSTGAAASGNASPEDAGNSQRDDASSEDAVEEPPSGQQAASGSAGFPGAAHSSQRAGGQRFQRRHKLGEGGQGEVWLAFDPKLGRYVALKEIKPGLTGSQATVSGFRHEARLTGELEHPNIVAVYDAEDVEDSNAPPQAGQAPFYVMRVFGNRHIMKAISEFYVRPRSAADHGLLNSLNAVQKQPSDDNRQRLREALAAFPFNDQQACDRRLKEAVESYLDDPQALDGRSLHDAVRDLHADPWSPDSERTLRELLRRFIHVCNAIGYAHSRGLIHRDLKPQNVMLGGFGETLVVDWGLAKVVGRDDLHADGGEGTVSAVRGSDQTIAGSIKGTPQYMPPEQARGDVTSLGPKSDIYSLGAILYALLTGRPPVTGNSAHEILEKVKDARLDPPTAHNPQAPKPLEAVCLKALSEKPLDRYQTAQELAADVARWLDDEPVTAWPEPFTIRARRWVKRHQTLVASTAAAVLMAAVTLSVMFVVVTGQNEQLAQLNRDLDSSNQQLEEKNTELTASIDRETAARQLAQQNEQRAIAGEELARQNEARAVTGEELAKANAATATAQSNLALSTLNSVIFNLQRSLKNVAGGAAVRRQLLSTVLPQLEQVSTEFADKSAVDRNTMAALIALGDVVLQLGTSDVGWASSLSFIHKSPDIFMNNIHIWHDICATTGDRKQPATIA